jgi:hypothetical protein
MEEPNGLCDGGDPSFFSGYHANVPHAQHQVTMGVESLRELDPKWEEETIEHAL